MYTETKIYFKELAHTMVETGRSKLCRVCQQAGDTGRASDARSLKAILQWILFFLGDTDLFILLLPTHIAEGNLLYSDPLTETLG